MTILRSKLCSSLFVFLFHVANAAQGSNALEPRKRIGIVACDPHHAMMHAAHSSFILCLKVVDLLCQMLIVFPNFFFLYKRYSILILSKLRGGD